MSKRTENKEKPFSDIHDIPLMEHAKSMQDKDRDDKLHNNDILAEDQMSVIDMSSLNEHTRVTG